MAHYSFSKSLQNVLNLYRFSPPLQNVTKSLFSTSSVSRLQLSHHSRQEENPESTPSDVSVKDASKDRTRVIPVETSIRYLKSAGKKKGKFAPKSGRFDNTSDEESIDNCSVISIASEGTYVEEGSEEVDEQSQNDIFEEKLVEAIEGMTQKSAQGRTNALEAVCNALSRKYIPDFVTERRVTLSDCAERSLKKGRGAEQVAAAQLASLLCIQLGPGDMADDVCRQLSPTLSFIACDNSMGMSARGRCCWALAILSFLADVEDVETTMDSLMHIFAGSFHKGDGSVANIPTDMATLHAAAISAWTLLLTVVSDVRALPSITQLSQLLDSPHLEVRMAAGEAIAVLLEQTSEWDLKDDLVDKLRQLATDSHKYRAKKDRKTQRSSFRDILKYCEGDDPPQIQVRFGQETLLLDCWNKKKQYDTLCQLLGSGVNLHLTENEFVRDILELGEKISPLNLSNSKQTKMARRQMNAANFKARSITRGKNRDKRSVGILA